MVWWICSVLLSPLWGLGFILGYINRPFLNGYYRGFDYWQIKEEEKISQEYEEYKKRLENFNYGG